MDTTDYRLPDGRIVAVDATAAKMAALIDFQLTDGTIVQAVRVNSFDYEYARQKFERER